MRKKERVFRSIAEIEKTYFPKYVEEKRREEIMEDPYLLGIELAKKSIKKIEKGLEV